MPALGGKKMLHWSLPLLLAAAAGALMPVQGALNAWLTRHGSLAMTTLWVHGTATLATGGLLLFLPAARASLSNLLQAPVPALLGGLVGVGITWLVAAAVAPLGAATATTGILVAQIITAAVLDHFGLLGLRQAQFTTMRALGAALLAVGSWLLLRK